MSVLPLTTASTKGLGRSVRTMSFHGQGVRQLGLGELLSRACGHMGVWWPPITPFLPEFIQSIFNLLPLLCSTLCFHNEFSLIILSGEDLPSLPPLILNVPSLLHTITSFTVKHEWSSLFQQRWLIYRLSFYLCFLFHQHQYLFQNFDKYPNTWKTYNFTIEPRLDPS